MAGDDASSASPKSHTHQRTSSSNSTGKAATGQRGKTSKTHAVGKHNRNASFGRNLNKLARLTGGEEPPVRTQRAKSTYTPSGSPTASHVRRNKSDVALPRSGSKVQIKKNQSAIALKRNESTSRLKRLSRPTTPRDSKEEEESQLKGHAQPAFGFGSDDDDDDDEDDWTEESASQSPVATRTGSMKGSRPKLETRHSSNTAETQTVRGDSPVTPVADVQRLVFAGRPSRPPDPAAITKHLLSRNSSSQLAPKLSTVSAGGSSGTQSPNDPDSNGLSMLSSQISMPPTSQPTSHPSKPSESNASIPSDPSLGKEGVSRFLDPHAAASSSGRNATALHDAMDMLRTQSSRSRSPSPNPATASAPAGEGVRRAKSAGYLPASDSNTGNLRSQSQQRHRSDRRDSSQSQRGHSRQTSFDDDPRAWTVTVDPMARRSGGNTQVKLELWRIQSQAADAEPPSVGPPPLMQSMHGIAAASGYLGVEERRIKMAKEADSELAFLKVFRNPTSDSIDRVRRERKKKQKERDSVVHHVNGSSKASSRGKENHSLHALKDASRPSTAKTMDRSRPASRAEALNGHSTSNGTNEGSLGSGGTAVDGESFEPHTPGRRNVRFDVGADGHADEDTGNVGSDEQRLAGLLRSMWEGAEAEVDS